MSMLSRCEFLLSVVSGWLVFSVVPRASRIPTLGLDSSANAVVASTCILDQHAIRELLSKFTVNV